MRKNCDEIIEELKEEIHELKHCVKALNKTICECEKEKECLLDELDECRDKKCHKHYCDEDCDKDCHKHHCDEDCDDDCKHKHHCKKDDCDNVELLLKFNNMSIEYKKICDDNERLKIEMNNTNNMNLRLNQMIKLLKR